MFTLVDSSSVSIVSLSETAIFCSLTSTSPLPRQVSSSLSTLQTCLSNMMNEAISMEQLRREVGVMIEKITLVTVMLRSLGVTMQEYVCLKVIALLNDCEYFGTSGNSLWLADWIACSLSVWSFG